MPYTALTAAQTDANSPLDQTLMDAIRTNSADHETRITTLENPSLRVFSHFDERTSDSGILVSGVGVLATLHNYLGKFTISNDGTIGGSGSAQTVERITAGGSDEHVLRFNSVSGTGTDDHEFYMYAQPVIRAENRTKPIRYETRIKLSDVINSNIGAFFGFLTWELLTWDTTPNSGIYLESTGTQLRFTAANGGSFTNGSSLTPPSDAAWFKVRIDWEDDPSDRARCYIDYEGGSGWELQETLAADLPAAVDLHAGARFRNVTELSQNVDFDYHDSYYSGALSDVA